MKEKIKENFKGSKAIVTLIIGAGTLLLVTFGAAYAYFSVTSDNNATNTTSTGALQSTGNVTLTTNTPNLYLNLDGVLMSEGNIGTKYWATTDTSGTPITNATAGNGIYTLATVSLASGETQYNCTYNYDLSATVNTPITDGSDEDIKVTIKGSSITGGEETYTLKDILAGSQTLTGTFKRVTAGTNQIITIESTVENTGDKQDDFAGNNYSITLTPKAGNEGFSCTVAEPLVLSSNLATRLIEEGKMWQSGLEDDGYRFTGTGVTCSYDNGNYTVAGPDSGCPTVYNITETDISDGKIWEYKFEHYCPPNDSDYTYSCTELTATITADASPDNFICFGTTSLTECKANEEKYLYRIIGVFEDNQGNNSVKLIKYKQLPTAYAWHNTNDDVAWESSDLYNGLNGSYFLTNTAYDYMQTTTWTNKITNWTWSAVNTKTRSDFGPNYFGITNSNTYLHEMNRTTKSSTIGSWTNPQAKIGLMYVSDYALSLGVTAISMTTDNNTKTRVLSTGWMNQSNNDINAFHNDWTISRRGGNDGYWYAWYVYSGGYVDGSFVHYANGARPVFYLTSDVEYVSGSGDYSDPIIIG